MMRLVRLVFLCFGVLLAGVVHAGQTSPSSNITPVISLRGELIGIEGDICKMRLYQDGEVADIDEVYVCDAALREGLERLGAGNGLYFAYYKRLNGEKVLYYAGLERHELALNPASGYGEGGEPDSLFFKGVTHRNGEGYCEFDVFGADATYHFKCTDEQIAYLEGHRYKIFMASSDEWNLGNLLALEEVGDVPAHVAKLKRVDSESHGCFFEIAGFDLERLNCVPAIDDVAEDEEPSPLYFIRYSYNHTDVSWLLYHEKVLSIEGDYQRQNIPEAGVFILQSYEDGVCVYQGEKDRITARCDDFESWYGENWFFINYVRTDLGEKEFVSKSSLKVADGYFLGATESGQCMLTYFDGESEQSIRRDCSRELLEQLSELTGNRSVLFDFFFDDERLYEAVLLEEYEEYEEYEEGE